MAGAGGDTETQASLRQTDLPHPITVHPTNSPRPNRCVAARRCMGGGMLARPVEYGVFPKQGTLRPGVGRQKDWQGGKRQEGRVGGSSSPELSTQGGGRWAGTLGPPPAVPLWAWVPSLPAGWVRSRHLAPPCGSEGIFPDMFSVPL